MSRQSTVRLRVLTTKKPANEKMEQQRKGLNEETLRRLSHDLGERVKELNCLYGLSKLIEDKDNALEKIMKGCINLIPPAWQYPEITCARITLGGKEFRSENFKETVWKLASEIRVKELGTLEVYYLEEKPESYEGPFLKEERNLIDIITERLGKTVDSVRTDETLKGRTHDLNERVKELNCLYGISKLVEKPGISLNDILQGTIELIQSSWQYPEITCARITLEGIEFKTRNFIETTWRQANNLFFHGETIGSLEVFYLEDKPASDEGPFLKEERSLLDVIAERLGKIIERIRDREALKESEGLYRILVESVADGVSLVQDGKIIFVNNEFSSIFSYLNAYQLVNVKASDLISNDFREKYQTLDNDLEKGKAFRKTLQLKGVSKDGRELWIEGRYNRITWKGRPAVLGTIRDITDKKLKEIEMEEEAKQLRNENMALKATIKDRFKFGNIIGKSSVMQELYELIIAVSASDTNVVIYGDSGTGKELVAQTIHDMCDRRNKTFVPVNCGAIPENLFESEFFGYRKGAFTGAERDTHGFFDLAYGGTLFLDEVAELSLQMQVKLLRAIEDGGYMPVGGNQIRKNGARILAATSRNLQDQVKEGLMREDFFYRVHIVPIYVPPLRDRREDIPLLIEHFLKSNGNGEKKPDVLGKVMDTLCNYDWPGNVRQLQNVLHRFLTLKRLDFADAYGQFMDDAKETPAGFNIDGVDDGPDFHKTMKRFEKTVIIDALKKNFWHKADAALMLGLPRRTFFRKLRNFELI